MKETFEEYSARLLRGNADSHGISYAELTADWPPPACPRCADTGWLLGVGRWIACDCPAAQGCALPKIGQTKKPATRSPSRGSDDGLDGDR